MCSERAQNAHQTSSKQCQPAMESDGTDISQHELMYVRTYMCRQQKSRHIYDTHNKESFTTQVQVSMSTVPMQQVCPERAQNASDKQ